jgi:transposase
MSACVRRTSSRVPSTMRRSRQTACVRVRHVVQERLFTKEIARYAPRHRDAYPLEFKTKLVALVLTGRSPEELAEEFDASGQTFRNWLRRAQLDAGDRKDRLTSDERQAITPLRKRRATRYGTRNPLKSIGLVRTAKYGTEAIFGFMKAYRATYPIHTMCRVLTIDAYASRRVVRRSYGSDLASIAIDIATVRCKPLA